ncbi:uncharacterized protein LOC135500849 isoform X2 [Lineus longissimus]|uniref:uncharacterized protein LOC135500849 isoform X2 n=1 Tax=Lineus longissimus TaxID=88925 RepID=UPI00315D6B10
MKIYDSLVQVIAVLVTVFLRIPAFLTLTGGECPTDYVVHECLAHVNMGAHDLEDLRYFGLGDITKLEGRVIKDQIRAVKKQCRHIDHAFECLVREIRLCRGVDEAHWVHEVNLDGMKRAMKFICQNYEAWARSMKYCTPHTPTIGYPQLLTVCEEDERQKAVLYLSRNLRLRDELARRCSNQRIEVYCKTKSMYNSCWMGTHNCAALVPERLKMDSQCWEDVGYIPPRDFDLEGRYHCSKKVDWTGLSVDDQSLVHIGPYQVSDRRSGAGTENKLHCGVFYWTVFILTLLILVTS